jgi:hypothetical protein
MSALNGDKARFQRIRKASLQRRSRLLLAAIRTPAPDGGEAGGPPVKPRRPGSSLGGQTETI